MFIELFTRWQCRQLERSVFNHPCRRIQWKMLHRIPVPEQNNDEVDHHPVAFEIEIALARIHLPHLLFISLCIWLLLRFLSENYASTLNTTIDSVLVLETQNVKQNSNTGCGWTTASCLNLDLDHTPWFIVFIRSFAGLMFAWCDDNFITSFTLSLNVIEILLLLSLLFVRRWVFGSCAVSGSWFYRWSVDVDAFEFYVFVAVASTAWLREMLTSDRVRPRMI